MNDEELKVKIGLDLSELRAEFIKGFTEGVKEGLQDIQKEAQKSKDELVEMGEKGKQAGDGMGFSFDKLKGILTAVAAAFSAMKLVDFTNQVAEASGAADDLAKSLGMTFERSQALIGATKSIDIPLEDVVGAMKKLNQQLVSNEGGLNAYGVATRGLNGELLSQEQLFQNAIGVLGQYKEGTDRNALAVELFGRSNIDLAKAAELTTEKIDETAQSLKDVGVLLSGEQRDALETYEQSMRDAGEVVTGLKNVIGTELAPVLTEVLQEFRANGPAIVETFRTIFSEVVSVLSAFSSAVFEVVKFIVQTIFDAWNDLSQGTATTWDDFQNIIGAALAGTGQALIGFVTVVKSVFDGIVTIVRVAVGSIVGAIETIKSAIDGVKDAASKLGEGTVLETLGENAKKTAAVASATFGGVADETTNLTEKLQENSQKYAQSVDKLFTSISTRLNPIKREIKDTSTEINNLNKGTLSFPGANSNLGKGAGGKGAGAGGAADDAAKQQIAFIKALNEQELKLFQAQLKIEEAELKRSYDRREISAQDYFTAVGDIRQRAIQAEIQAREQEKEQLNVQLEQATKRGAKESEILQLKTKMVQLDTQIATLEKSKTEQVVKTANEIDRANEATQKQLNGFRSQLAALTGVEQLQAKLADIAQKFAELPANIRGDATVQELQRTEQSLARVAALESEQSKARELAEARIQAVRASGSITEQTAREKILTIERSLLAEKIKILEAERETARLAGDGARTSQLEREIELLRLKNETIKEGNEETKKFSDDLQSSLQGNIEGLLNGTKSLKDAILGIGADIVKSINSMIAKKISQSITDSIMGGKDGQGGGGFGGLFKGLFGGGGGGNDQANAATQGLANAATIATNSLTTMSANGVDAATQSFGENILKTTMNSQVSSELTSSFQQLSQAAQQAASSLQSIQGGAGAVGGGGAAGGGLFGSSGGMFGGLFSNLFGGFFAEGGYQFAGKPYIVGDNGPEIFVPQSSGNIIPNDQLSGMGSGANVYMTVNTPDASSFRRAKGQVMNDYQRALMRANRRNG